ncbi:MAG: hypothetical protein R3F30_03680 [Planctomycetota bacterium]
MSARRADGSFGRVWVGFEDEPIGLVAALRTRGHEVRDLDLATEAPAEGDLVLLSVDWRGGSPFLTCSRLKEPHGPWIAVVLVYADEADASLVEPLAQFCLADGLLHLPPEGAGSVETLDLLFTALEVPRPRESTEELLAGLETRLGADAGALADRVLTGLSTERGRSFLTSVTDPQSGLYNTGFMAFKLEEEVKRSRRFRLPLSVLILDLPLMRELDEEARTEALVTVSGRLLTECRDIDFMGRFDESSFLMLLPCTGPVGARISSRACSGSWRGSARRGSTSPRSRSRRSHGPAWAPRTRSSTACG